MSVSSSRKRNINMIIQILSATLSPRRQKVREMTETHQHKKKKSNQYFFLAYNSTLYFQTLYSGALRSDLLVYKAMYLSALVIHAELVPCPYVPRQIQCPLHHKVF